jgi:hypothetical protein
MQARAATDPTGWTFQGAIHGAYAAPPPGAGWNRCQHQGWFFLPWHRMYMYYLERIVRAAVKAAGGPADFALPYWNYSKPFPANTLPIGFRTATLPDGGQPPVVGVPEASSGHHERRPAQRDGHQRLDRHGQDELHHARAGASAVARSDHSTSATSTTAARSS